MRGLSDTEAASAYSHALLGGSGRLTASFDVDGVVPLEQVGRAVEPWIRRLAPLSLRIEDTGGDGLRFRRGAPGPCPVQAYPAVDEGEDTLAEGGRLWRLRAGHDRGGSTRFRLTLHPAICDGYSTARYVRPLLDALFAPPGHDAGQVRGQALPPGTDALTYEGGGACTCGVCMPSGSPRRVRRTTTPYAGHGPYGGGRRELHDGPGPGRAGDAVTLALTSYESRRLRDWCEARQLTVSGFLSAVLADALARETGCEEVTVATSVSLRRRYAERTLIAEPGCVTGTVRVPLRSGAGGDPVSRAGAHAAALCAAARAWRPDRRAHAVIRRSVEREAAGTGIPELRVTDAGSVDTALGPHTGRMTGFRAAAAPGAGQPGGTLHLSSFKGALTLALTSRGLGTGWPAVAERELAEAALLRPALLPA
ncbi:hypothetical protein [Streptomyces sp. NPDC059446]|uniref:hypothetical protein n=1 Tax=Streptomyces sp. NPDC059446 TaxID=3346833 RepID=UPI0036B68BE3